MPKIHSILETALYVDDLERATAFYEGIMGLPVLHADDRMCAYNINGRSVLLLFVRGATTEPVHTPGGVIPPHDGSGQLHIAFAVTPDEMQPWRAHLAAHGITIVGTSDWKNGGHSLYFRDPDGNLLELATTPGVWDGF
ncbi:VOC family protein [Roseinatronobacter sp. S2]|uniref:VOC family protein n=1 Tax=Roseinatronobacter sp. S2 TaxID=3035471 RepID=UPI00240FC84B|nr:VOC family protein [Roseinatronobacter sp. S2]WFE76594.1 VOC family protein [Roseinatronobacter sp. S2]